MTITEPNPSHLDAAAPDDPAAGFMALHSAHWTGASAIVLAMVGDELGLFRGLAAGPLTSSELADRTSTTERYVREWLAGMATAGYVVHDGSTGRFALAPGAAEVLGVDGPPTSMGGFLQCFGGQLRRLDDVLEAFRRGGGVPQERIHPSFYEGMARMTALWHDHLLVPAWIESEPGVADRLRAGATVADIGCGSGRAVVRLAEAFPASTFVGFDVFAPAVDSAREAVAAAGVADRARIELRDVADGLPGCYDLVTAFDVLHDAADPAALLRSVRQALADDGVFLCLEVSCGDTIEDNLTRPFATSSYATSLFYCLTTSIAQGGAGLGTCGMPRATLERLARAAGFGSVEVLAEDPFNTLYAVRP